MRGFRKIKREVLPAIKAGWAAKVSGRMEEAQLRLALYLNGKTAHLSLRGKWLFLVLVCLAFGGFSLYLLVRAFF